MHLDVSSPVLSIRVVIMPNLHASMNLTRSSTFSLTSGSVRLVALYGSAGLSPTSVLLKDIFLYGLVLRVLDGNVNGDVLVILAECRRKQDGGRKEEETCGGGIAAT